MTCKAVSAVLFLTLSVAMAATSPKFLWCRIRCSAGGAPNDRRRFGPDSERDGNMEQFDHRNHQTGQWVENGQEFDRDVETEPQEQQMGEREQDFEQRGEREQDFEQGREREHDFEQRGEGEQDFEQRGEREQDFEQRREREQEFEQRGEKEQDFEQRDERERHREDRIPVESGADQRGKGETECPGPDCRETLSSEQQTRQCYASCSFAYDICSRACPSATGPISEEWAEPNCFTTCYAEMFSQVDNWL